MAQGPDVVYVGCQKTGSTFLRSYFTFHPSLAWTRHATAFQHPAFDLDDYQRAFRGVDRGDCLIDMYEALALGYVFEGVVEWSGREALAPASALQGAALRYTPRALAGRIKAAVPEARILMTIRNPVDWIRSNYLHYLPQMPERRRSFRDFLSTPEGKLVLAAACYDRTIELYRELFGADRVLVLTLEELHRQESASLQALCAFLGVPFRSFPDEYRQRNEGMGSVKAGLIRLYSSLGVSDRVAKAFAPAYRACEGRVPRWLRTDVISARDIELLRACYAASNLRTAELLGKDLTAYGYAT